MGLKDPYDFNESSDFAARYMQWLLKQTGGNLSEALAAYNGGIGNLKSKGLERMPAESQRYHAQVMARLPQAHAMSPTATRRERWRWLIRQWQRLGGAGQETRSI